MGARTTPAAMYIPRTIDELQVNHPDALRFFSGDISFRELDDVAIDVRGAVGEHRSSVIDLTTERAPIA
jgi:hypothetical protein